MHDERIKVDALTISHSLDVLFFYFIFLCGEKRDFLGLRSGPLDFFYFWGVNIWPYSHLPITNIPVIIPVLKTGITLNL